MQFLTAASLLVASAATTLAAPIQPYQIQFAYTGLQWRISPSGSYIQFNISETHASAATTPTYTCSHSNLLKDEVVTCNGNPNIKYTVRPYQDQDYGYFSVEWTYPAGVLDDTSAQYTANGSLPIYAPAYAKCENTNSGQECNVPGSSFITPSEIKGVA